MVYRPSNSPTRKYLECPDQAMSMMCCISLCVAMRAESSILVITDTIHSVAMIAACYDPLLISVRWDRKRAEVSMADGRWSTLCMHKSVQLFIDPSTSSATRR
jgi:hypothetical protein